MKKRFLSVLLSAVCLVSLSACGQKDTAPESSSAAPEEPDQSQSEALPEQSAQQPADEDLLALIAEANTNEALLARHERISSSGQLTMADGTNFENSYYLDGELFARTNPGYYAAQHNDRVYEQIGDQKIGYCFFGSAQEEFIASNGGASLFVYSPNEVVTSSECRKDKLVVYTESRSADDIDMMKKDFDYTDAPVVAVISQYVVDQETYDLNSMASWCELDNGDRIQYFLAAVSPDPQPEQPDMELEAAIFENQPRTITVVADNGTENEETAVFQLGQGAAMRLMLPAAFDQTVYADADYTETAEINADLEQDATFYVRTAA